MYIFSSWFIPINHFLRSIHGEFKILQFYFGNREIISSLIQRSMLKENFVENEGYASCGGDSNKRELGLCKVYFIIKIFTMQVMV